jgi:hypothetical protein
MKRLGFLPLLLLLWAGAAAENFTAEQLIAKIEAAQKTSGFRTRARVIQNAADSKDPEVLQLLIKGRRQGDAVQTLYQVLWPKPVEGRTLVVETSADGTVSGFLFEPPGSKIPLTPELMAQPLFGTGVAVEDVAEAYWHWPLQKLAGDEMVAGHRCKILESRPGAGTTTSYSLVRSWIAPDLSLPLRVEKLGKDGRLERRFTAAKIARQGAGCWTAAVLVVDSSDGRRTTIEGTRSDRDLTLPADQFTVEGIKRSLAR